MSLAYGGVGSWRSGPTVIRTCIEHVTTIIRISQLAFMIRFVFFGVHEMRRTWKVERQESPG